jgi:cell fate regulator YaaT (PSP1 superfamily)
MAEDSFTVETIVAAVGVCFRKGGKVYFFLPAGFPVQMEDFVVVETDKGVDIGEVVEVLSRLGPEDERPTKKLLRPASEADVQRKRQLFAKEARALEVCARKLAEAGLPMKLIEASYTLDGKRLTFSFVAENRVDFRDLVRDLAQTFRCRIELRQVGVRDQAKALGGLGPCGRPLCCASFLRDFMSVGIRLAKDQGLSMNPAKLSGSCDRLMCCLRYEHEQYVDNNKRLPKIGAYLESSLGCGDVVDRNLLVGSVRLRNENGGEVALSWEDLEREGQLRPMPAPSPKPPQRSRRERPARREERPAAPSPPETAPASPEAASAEATAPVPEAEAMEAEPETEAEPPAPAEGPGAPAGRGRRRRGRRGGRRRGGGGGETPPAPSSENPS